MCFPHPQVSPSIPKWITSDLGLAAFDSGDFRVTDGWVTLKGGSVDLADIEEISKFNSVR